MTERDWVNPMTQDPTAADAVDDGRPTPGRPRPSTGEEPMRGATGERPGAADGRAEASAREAQAHEVPGSQLDDGTRADTELSN